jgi:competence protein ComEA
MSYIEHTEHDRPASVDPEQNAVELERHYNRLIGAVLCVVTAVVAWVGWSVLRSGQTHSEVVAAPRQVTIPLSAPLPAPVAERVPPTMPKSDPTPASTPQATTTRVHVAGAVRKPGVLTLPPQARVIDAVQKAGGARPDADLDAINLADFVRDGEQVRIPSRRERVTPPTAPVTVARSGASPAPISPTRVSRALPAATDRSRTLGRYPSTASEPSSTAPASTPAGSPVNVNTATLEELDTLPGVGPAIARRILDYRREHGPFQRPEDLLQVSGIGEKKLAAMLDRVRVR